ncbi:hypothetical protein BGX20_007830, partial [Mortierella sp. AD010]
NGLLNWKELQMVPVDRDNPPRPINQRQSPDIVMVDPGENLIDDFEQERNSIPIVVLLGVMSVFSQPRTLHRDHTSSTSHGPNTLPQTYTGTVQQDR